MRYIKYFEAVQYNGNVDELLTDAPKWLHELFDNHEMHYDKNINCLCYEYYGKTAKNKVGIIKLFVDVNDYIVLEDGKISIVKPNDFKGVEVE